MTNKFNFPNTKSVIAALVLCFAVSGAYSQTLVWPILSDQYWYSSAGSSNPIQGINVSSIAYTPPLSPTNFIYASVYYDGTTTPSIHAMDPVAGTATASYGGSVQGIPDIILGNISLSSTICPSCNTATSFALAAAYYNGNAVEVDYYLIQDAGLGTFTMNPTPVATQTVSATGTQTVHIDVIADATNIQNGYPLCSQFAITWDDYSAGGPFVYTALGDLNAGTLGIARAITTGGNTGYSPDVAAIMYGISTDPVALVTYVDGSTNDDLYLEAYDFPATAAILTTTLDIGSTSHAISVPRIDALDDYFRANTFSSATIAGFKVVAQVHANSGNEEVRTYDNLQQGWASSGVIDITAVPTYTAYPTSNYNNYAPTVAYNQDYLVSHFMQYNGATGGDILFMEPTVTSAPTTLVGSAYYWVDSTSVSPSTPPSPNNAYGTFANAVCTPPNDPGAGSLFAWAQSDGSGAITYDVFYKTTNLSYSFKPATGATAVTNITGGTGWQVNPNPATNELTVSAATAGTGTEYSITDMAGRILLHGDMPGKSTLIDVGRLVAGAYLLKIYGSENAGQTMFVKN